jgi:hypothetical protein
MSAFDVAMPLFDFFLLKATRGRDSCSFDEAKGESKCA